MKKTLRKFLYKDYPFFSGAFSLAFAVVSAFSVCVFYHMRNYSDVVSYYNNWKISMTRDIFTNPSYLWFLLLVPVFGGIYYFCFVEKTEFCLSELLCGAYFAINIIFALSMEHSDLREIFLPFANHGVSMVCNIAAFFGFFIICFFSVHLLYLFLNWKTKRIVGQPEKKKEFLFFLLGFLLLAACWAPGLSMCYPGSMYADTLDQVESFLGLRKIDASHPILTTVFYGSLFSWGREWIDDSFGVFLCVIVQSVFNCAVMSLVAVNVRGYTKSNIGYFATIFFYGILPIWPKAAQMALKDVLHTGCFLLFLTQYFHCLREERKKIGSVFLLCVYGVLVAFTRKATFWLAVACILILILSHWKAYRVKYGICLAVVMGLFFFCEKVVYPSLNIKAPREEENYSLQFQQFANYCRTYEKEITAEEKKIINRTLDFDRIIKKYTPMISDGVKGSFHGNAEDHKAFWELYFKYLKKHPLTFLKATIMNDFEHVNPWYCALKNGGVYIAPDADFYNAAFKSNDVWKINRYWNSWCDIPVARLFTSTGFFAWLLVAMIGYVAYKRNLMSFLGILPLIIFLIGLFFSHVNGSIRYGYPLIASTPLFIAFPIYAVSLKAAKAVKAVKAEGEQKLTPAHIIEKGVQNYSKLKIGLYSLLHNSARHLEKAIPQVQQAAVPPANETQASMPRSEITLENLLFLGIFAVLSNAKTCHEQEIFSKVHVQDYLKYGLYSGECPSEEHFRCVFSRLDTRAVGACFDVFAKKLKEAKGQGASDEPLAAGTGKAMKSAAACFKITAATPQCLSLAPSKQDEIPGSSAITGLLNLVDAKGSAVFIPSLEEGKPLMQMAKDRGYVCVIPVNREDDPLLETLQQLFRDEAETHDVNVLRKNNQFAGQIIETKDYHATLGCLMLFTSDHPAHDALAKEGISCAALLRNIKTDGISKKQTVQELYFIIGGEVLSGERFLQLYQVYSQQSHGAHCGFTMDMVFPPPEEEAREERARKNLDLFRRSCLQMIEADSSSEGTVETKEQMCGWSFDFALKLAQHWTPQESAQPKDCL